MCVDVPLTPQMVFEKVTEVTITHSTEHKNQTYTMQC